MLSPAAFELHIGQSRTLSAVARDAGGAEVTGKAVTWASSAPSVAEVSGGGVVTAVGSGTDTITATVGGVAGVAVVSATPVPVASVTVSPSPSIIYLGQSRTFYATLRDSAGTVIAGRLVTWMSSDTTVATISPAGTLTARAVGATSVTAASEGLAGSATVAVSLVPVASVTVSPKTDTITTAEADTLRAIARDSAGTALQGRVVSWTSSDSNIAAVSGGGIVRPRDSGRVLITATIDGKAGAVALSVMTFADLQPACTPAVVRIPRGTTVTLACTLATPTNISGGLAFAGVHLPAGIRIQPLRGAVADVGAGSIDTVFLAVDVDSVVAPQAMDATLLVTVGAVGQRFHLPLGITTARAQVHAIYLLPSDRRYDSLVAWGIERAVRHLQIFYQHQLGDSATFSIHYPVVTVLHSAHPSADFAANAYALPAQEVFTAFQSGYYDPHNVWVIYFDVVPTSASGGSASVATLTHGDVVGVADEDLSGSTLGRWVGGLGHELGHAFGLPHPPGCDAGTYTDACNAIMYWGYANYPNTFLTADERAQLEDSTYVSTTVTTTTIPFDVNNFESLRSSAPSAPVANEIGPVALPADVSATGGARQISHVEGTSIAPKRGP